jgi:FkbM family methyltransferase
MPALRHRATHFLLRRLGLFNRSYREKIDGRWFTIPIINGRKTYASEPWMSEIIRRLFELKLGAFIDVGVNLGQTLLKVAAIDPDRIYVGFEPNPACADYAWKLIEANGLDFALIPAGVSNETTLVHLEMFRADDTDPSASIVPAFRANVVARRPVIVIDPEQLPEAALPDKVAIVKVDVEGGELYVLEGLKPLIERTRPFLVVEILPASEPQRVERQTEIERHLAALDYRMFRIRHSGNEQFEGFAPIDTIGVPRESESWDYLFAPAELAIALSA